MATFQNSGFVLSIGIFFSLMIAGLASTLPTTLTGGLAHQGVPHAVALQIGKLPPVGSLFAAFLGYNPVHTLLAPTGVLAHLPSHNVAVLTGKQFFPQLISGPFHHGLVIVFTMAACVLVIAAILALRHSGAEVISERLAAENGTTTKTNASRETVAQAEASARPATGTDPVPADGQAR
jgi:hypothetical protein